MSDTRTLTTPAGLYDPTPFGYSHTASATGETVFTAGQYASDDTGQVVPGDFAAQVERSLDNLRDRRPAGRLPPTPADRSRPPPSRATPHA
ncbi:RidA family protein [Kitasatospora sp. NPDC003701]